MGTSKSRGGDRVRGGDPRAEAKADLVYGYWLAMEARTCGTLDTRAFRKETLALVSQARGEVLGVKRRIDAAFADAGFRDAIGVTPATVLTHWVQLSARCKAGAA